MIQEQLIKDIIEINRRVCFNLWNIASVNGHSSGFSPRLILPKKRSGEIRISEQESRVLYCSVLNNLNYYYSIETPTENVYKQKGISPVSASSDLSIYIQSGDEFSKISNVEFKAHNPNVEHIRKDIEKFIKENVTGNWFHTLKNIDNKTIHKLFDKFKNSFIECSDLICCRLSFVFCICVIEKQWACIKEFSFDPNNGNAIDYVSDFFDIGYFVNSSTPEVHVNDSNGWIVVQ